MTTTPGPDKLEDDPSILGEDVFYRRVRAVDADWSTLDADGRPRIRAGAFQDFSAAEAQRRGYPRACMSVGLGSLLQKHNRDPSALLDGWGDEYGIAVVSVAVLRENGQGVMPWATPAEPWHAVVFSVVGAKRTEKMKSVVAENATWIRVPPRPTPAVP